MTDYLTFTLAAPLAAMGDVAVGERRGTADRPARSAVLGLVAGCLGLDRSDEDAHLALERDYGFALRVEWVGPLLADYHTAQVPSTRRGRRYATRAAELAVSPQELNTILSRRDYRSDLLAFAALWQRKAEARWPLATLAAALERPVFTPYLGRKSCPLMLPLAPSVRRDLEDFRAALADHGKELRAQAAFGRLVRPWGRHVPVVVVDADAAAGLSVARIERRRDRIASRRRWQFELREEAVLQAPAP